MTAPETTEIQRTERVTQNKLARASRITEITLAALGAAILAGNKVVEWVMVLRGFEVEYGFTFSDFVIAALLVAPFTLGRATAGKVWVGIANTIASRLGKKPTP